MRLDFAGAMPRALETPKMSNYDPWHGSGCFQVGVTFVDRNASSAELDPNGEPDAAETDALAAAAAVAVRAELEE